MSTKMCPCKHLDHEEGKYTACELKDISDQFPECPGGVKFWRRGKVWTDGGNPQDVQFCGQGRGRINGIFQCYNPGEMPCYDPTAKK